MSEHVVIEPYLYLTNNTKGKGFRSKFIDAFNVWLKVSPRELEIVKGIVKKLHNASLLIDDIEDNSKLRRGIPCAHLIFGVPATINSANYIYFEALNDCRLLQNVDSIRVFMDEMLNLHRGQAMDIHWRDNVSCPTEEEYIQMTMDKTGGLFRLSVGLMQSLSTNKEADFTPLVNKLAALFQILDDYLNMRSSRYHKNKSYAEDLTEGKFSFPILHSIQSNPQDKRLINILKTNPTDDLIKRYAVDVMRSTGSFEYTIKVVHQLEREVHEHISKMGSNIQLTRIIDALLQQIEPEDECHQDVNNDNSNNQYQKCDGCECKSSS